jgi:GAF domain-containing protein
MRFTPPPLLREHGVVSGMTVVIADRERPFGVLGAHTQSLRPFSEDNVNFLQAVANVLAIARCLGVGDLYTRVRGRGFLRR